MGMGLKVIDLGLIHLVVAGVVVVVVSVVVVAVVVVVVAMVVVVVVVVVVAEREKLFTFLAAGFIPHQQKARMKIVTIGALSWRHSKENWGPSREKPVICPVLPFHCGPEKPRIPMSVLGHSLVCSLVRSHRSHRSLIRLLRTARFARALRCAHSFARSLHSLPRSWDSG